MIYTNKKNQLYNYCQAIIHATSEIIRIAEQNKLTDEQFFIDFEDKLNELSLVGWKLEFVLPDGRHYFKRHEVEL